VQVTADTAGLLLSDPLMSWLLTGRYINHDKAYLDYTGSGEGHRVLR